MQRLNRKDIPHLKKHPYLRQKSKQSKPAQPFISTKNTKLNSNVSMKYKADNQQKQNKPIANMLPLRPLTIQHPPNLSSKPTHHLSLIETDSSQQQTNQIPLHSHLHSSPCSGQLEDYLQDIQAYLQTRRKQTNINHQYLYNHNILTYKLRSYFVRHIFKLYNKFNLKRTTLYLSVEYMDLYFSAHSCFHDQFQIISAVQACLFMAMKYEEIYPPCLKDWVDRRNIQEIIKIQANILKTINFQLNQETSENHRQHLLSTLQKQNRLNSQHNNHSLFLLDLCLFDINMRQFSSRKLAQNVYYMLDRPQLCDENVVKNIRWMIQRNKPSIEWLLDNVYKNIEISNIV